MGNEKKLVNLFDRELNPEANTLVRKRYTPRRDSIPRNVSPIGNQGTRSLAFIIAIKLLLCLSLARYETVKCVDRRTKGGFGGSYCTPEFRRYWDTLAPRAS